MTTATKEARSDLRDEIEEIDADVIGIREEIREAKERLAEALASRADKLAEYKALKA
jgi:hypothetical protein